MELAPRLEESLRLLIQRLREHRRERTEHRSLIQRQQREIARLEAAAAAVAPDEPASWQTERKALQQRIQDLEQQVRQLQVYGDERRDVAKTVHAAVGRLKQLEKEMS